MHRDKKYLQNSNSLKQNLIKDGVYLHLSTQKCVVILSEILVFVWFICQCVSVCVWFAKFYNVTKCAPYYFFTKPILFGRFLFAASIFLMHTFLY